MIIDTSAVLAILLNEAERRSFNEQIEAAESVKISAANYVEASIVIEARFGADGVRDLDLFMARADIEIAPVDAEQAKLACYAWRRFGKSRHKAALNFGDCFAYALAVSFNEPLLYKGKDFTMTDVRREI